MAKNDAIVIGMIKKGDGEIAKKEAALRDKLTVAVAAMDDYEKALAGEREELEEGALNCDDALNKGCITVDGPMGMSLKVNLRTAPAPQIKAMLEAMAGYERTEQELGVSLGEKGHSVKEWKDDLLKAWKNYHATTSELLNDAEAKRADALGTAKEIDELNRVRTELIGLLSDEYLEEVAETAKLLELCEANPDLVVGELPVVELKPYEIPADMAEMYVRVASIAPIWNGHPCGEPDGYDDDDYDGEEEWEADEF